MATLRLALDRIDWKLLLIIAIRVDEQHVVDVAKRLLSPLLTRCGVAISVGDCVRSLQGIRMLVLVTRRFGREFFGGPWGREGCSSGPKARLRSPSFAGWRALDSDENG